MCGLKCQEMAFTASLAKRFSGGRTPHTPLSVTGLLLATLIFSDFFVSGHSHA